jgi:hypothetical protein
MKPLIGAYDRLLPNCVDAPLCNQSITHSISAVTFEFLSASSPVPLASIYFCGRDSSDIFFEDT